MLQQLTELRSMAYDMANSGRFGKYPYDETFYDEVEDGFNYDGTMWEAKDGTIITIERDGTITIERDGTIIPIESL